LCCDAAMGPPRLEYRLRERRRRRLSSCVDVNKIVVAWVILFFLFPAGAVVADEIRQDQWQTVKTKHTIIRYKSSEDLTRFNHKIRFSAGNHRFLFFSSSRDGKDPAQEISRKVDAIFERVQRILDMRKGMKKVVINVYHDRDKLDAAYFMIYRQPCRIRAWYRYWNNTIYLNAMDLHEEILAHEMAHAIIDHYMVVRPPRATAEILARYVDQHLKE